MRAGKVVATVAAPFALDAQGQAVPSRYQLAGERLTVAVVHSGGDYAYAIMLDPVIDQQLWAWDAPSDPGGWDYTTPRADGHGSQRFALADEQFVDAADVIEQEWRLVESDDGPRRLMSRVARRLADLDWSDLPRSEDSVIFAIDMDTDDPAGLERQLRRSGSGSLIRR